MATVTSRTTRLMYLVLVATIGAMSVGLVQLGAGAQAGAAKPSFLVGGACPATGCSGVDNDVDTAVVSRFRFSVPTRGTASVTSSGSLVCRTTDGTSPGEVLTVDVLAQILGSAGNAVDPNGPSILRFYQTATTTAGPSAMTFSLATTRVFHYSTAGLKNVALKLDRNSVDYPIFCQPNAVSLTVTYVPD